jgi:hypothetical protein
MSVEKTRLIAFKGCKLLQSIVLIDDKIIEQVTFNYLGNLMSSEK